MAGMTDDAEQDNVRRLLAAGFVAEDILRIAAEAARTYEHNRTSHGQGGGALGKSGTWVYGMLLPSKDADVDLGAFFDFRIFDTETTAARVGLSRGAAAIAVNRLADHGFLIRRRDGRQFGIRLLIPSAALAEVAERWSRVEEEPTTYAGGVLRPLGERLLEIYPPIDA